MLFENEILDAIAGMSISFGFLFSCVYAWVRIEDWWKGDE